MTNHPTTPPAEASAREQQRVTVQVLTGLLEKDLPGLIWTTHPLRSGRLTGTASILSDTDQYEALRAWAAFLDAEIADESDATTDEMVLAGTADYAGVKVTVRARIRHTEAVTA